MMKKCYKVVIFFGGVFANFAVRKKSPHEHEGKLSDTLYASVGKQQYFFVILYERDKEDYGGR